MLQQAPTTSHLSTPDFSLGSHLQMRFQTLIAAAALATRSVVADTTTSALDISSLLPFDLSAANHYGAPLPPWARGAHPGWYFSQNPGRYANEPFPCLFGWICDILDLIPGILHCPKPSHTPPRPAPTPTGSPNPPADEYTQTFSNITGATQAGDYLTFGLVDTIADCKKMCDTVDKCAFANSYRDVNGKDGSSKLTCSLFTKCHDESDATNKGGQKQPDGSVNYIANSDGWCKK